MEKTSRRKIFFENFFIYGLFGSVGKIVPLIMLPIITRIITDTSEFGVYSMFTTIQSFGIQIAVLGLYDAVFREYFEKEDPLYRKKVLSTALDIVTIFSLIFGIAMVVFSEFFSNLFLGEGDYEFVIYLSAFGIICGATRSILSLPVRIHNQRAVYIVTNLLQAVLGYTFAIIMILVFDMNYASMIYSSVITSLILTIFYLFYCRKNFKVSAFSGTAAKTLLKIGIPLVPTFIIYWIFSSFDKVMITNMLGLHDVGIFTIGFKVASVSQIVYTAFATGWQYFAFKTMKDDDQVELTSKIMEYLSAVSVFIFMFATILDEPVFRLAFDGDYETGYIVFPYLFLAPLLLIIYQTGANQFLVYKKSYLSTVCLSIGAIANIIMNYFFIIHNGIAGAALATLLSYLISIVLMVIITSKKKWIALNPRMFILIGMVLIISLKIYFADNFISNILAGICIFIIFFLYIKDVKKLFSIKKILK